MTRCIPFLVCLLVPSFCSAQFSLFDEPSSKDKSAKVEAKEAPEAIPKPEGKPQAEEPASETSEAPKQGEAKEEPQKAAFSIVDSISEPADVKPAEIPEFVGPIKPDEIRPLQSVGPLEPTVKPISPESSATYGLNLVLQGKDVVPGSHPDYFRITGKDGRTTLLVPSDAASFDHIPDHPYYHNNGILDLSPVPDKVKSISVQSKEDKPPVEFTKLNKMSYNDAYTKSLLRNIPLMALVVQDQKQYDYINSMVDELTDFIAFNRFFCLSVMNQENPNFKALEPTDHDVQLIVWYRSKKTNSWVKKHYAGATAVDNIVDRVKKWCRKNASTKDGVFLRVN